MVASRRGKNKAVVALDRKILCIIHHLLVNGEEYVEESFTKLTQAEVQSINPHTTGGDGRGPEMRLLRSPSS
jgi:hypothetical protein